MIRLLWRHTPIPSDAKRSILAEENTPNPPLKFRLEKLQRDHPYLIGRGLAAETIVEFGVGYCAKGLMADRIAIPIQNSVGEVVAYAGRRINDSDEKVPKYKLPQGFRKSLELFNIHRALNVQDEGPLIVVEGFLDCKKLHQLGARKTVALMGCSMSQAQENMIRMCTRTSNRVIIMLDEDEAGKSGRESIAIRLAPFTFVHIQIFTENAKQPEHFTQDEVAKVTR